MLKKILGAVAALIVIVVALGFVLPDRVEMSREIVIDAPQEDIFALVADLNRHARWAPWGDYDPDMKTTIAGEGVGQKMVWTSEKMGEGSQEITALDAPSRADFYLDFGANGVAEAAIALSPVEGGVRAVWSFETNMREGAPFWMKPPATYMGFFMEGMLGKDYEKGLANLKREAEAGGADA